MNYHWFKTLKDLPSTVDINNIIYPEKPEE